MISATGTLSFTLAANRNRDWANGVNNRIVVTLTDSGPITKPTSTPRRHRRSRSTFDRSTIRGGDEYNSNDDRRRCGDDFYGRSSLTRDFAGTRQCRRRSFTEPNGFNYRYRSAIGTRRRDQFYVTADHNFPYIPSPSFNGQDTFTYQLSDSGNPAATTIVTVTVNVTAVNNPPEFTAGGNVAVNEDSGSYSQTWATGIRQGSINSIDEAGQTVSFEVDSTNSALFSTVPSISPTGVLSFAPAQMPSVVQSLRGRCRRWKHSGSHSGSFCSNRFYHRPWCRERSADFHFRRERFGCGGFRFAKFSLGKRHLCGGRSRP